MKRHFCRWPFAASEGKGGRAGAEGYAEKVAGRAAGRNDTRHRDLSVFLGKTSGEWFWAVGGFLCEVVNGFEMGFS